LLPVEKNLSSPLCLKLRITQINVTHAVTVYKAVNIANQIWQVYRGVLGVIETIC
jgi:hypothetical protein